MAFASSSAPPRPALSSNAADLFVRHRNFLLQRHISPYLLLDLYMSSPLHTIASTVIYDGGQAAANARSSG